MRGVFVRSWLSAAGVGLGLFVAPSEASAYHTEKERITDRTAYTMPKNTLRLGIFRADYAMWDPFTIKTYIWPWVFRVPNLMMKWRPYGKDPWAFAVEMGFFAFDTSSLGALDSDVGGATIIALPIEVLSTYRFNEEHNLSASVLYTAVNVQGEVNSDALAGVGQGAVENAQLTSTYQWTVSKKTAFQLTGRMVLFQRLSASGDVTLMPDEYTTVEIIGQGEVQQNEVAGAASIQADAVFSWKSTNLRLGVGYGHYNIPGINFTLPVATIYPSFDLHWIF